MVIVNALNCTNLSCVYVIIVTNGHLVGVILKVMIMMVFSGLVSCYENMEMKYQYKYNVECIMFFVM